MHVLFLGCSVGEPSPGRSVGRSGKEDKRVGPLSQQTGLHAAGRPAGLVWRILAGELAAHSMVGNISAFSGSRLAQSSKKEKGGTPAVESILRLRDRPET